MDWKPYDPAWLAALAREQHPDMPWLADALAACTRAAWESRAYVHFVDPADANQPGSAWEFEENVVLEHPREGTIVLDVLRGQRVGGAEFLKHL
ncbi:hypothetical protein [Longimicrobium sp.]|jgi:hypothetical protein|uniref:hypothetical protein n=1 Tax=Longimicrobium sp. TaxID=2029185 RepID=UPI002ED94088